MAPVPLSALGLPETVAPAEHADFLESYARLVIGEHHLDSDDPTMGDDPRDGVREAAAAFCDAGTWALLFDTGRAATLLADSGRLYRQVGHGFGNLLLGATGARPPREVADDETALLAAATTGREAPRDLPRAMTSPPQLAYLLMSLSALAEAADVDTLEEVCALPDYARSDDPVGPLRAPLHETWATALDLVGGRSRKLLEHVDTLSTRHRHAVDQAMENRWVWQHGAPPVPPVDIEAVALVSLATHRLGERTVRLGMEGSDMNRTGLTVGELGMDLAQERRSWHG